MKRNSIKTLCLIIVMALGLCGTAVADLVLEDWESYDTTAELLAAWTTVPWEIPIYEVTLETDPAIVDEGNNCVKTHYDYNYSPQIFDHNPLISASSFNGGTDKWSTPIDLSQKVAIEAKYRPGLDSFGHCYVWLYSTAGGRGVAMLDEYNAPIYPDPAWDHGYVLQADSSTPEVWGTLGCSIPDHPKLGLGSGTWYTINWAEVTGMFLDVEAVKCEVSERHGTYWMGTIIAVDDPVLPIDPVPGNLDSGISKDLASVSWTPGTGADLGLGEEVWISDDEALIEAMDVSVENHVTTNSLTLSTALLLASPLDYKTTYYWRVQDHNGVTDYTGEVWQFTTEGGIENVFPKDGKDFTPIDVVFTWEKHPLATDQIMYFSETEADVINGVGGSSIALVELYDPLGATDLDLDTVYYWRVDEVIGSAVEGDVRSFRTEGRCRDPIPGDGAGNITILPTLGWTNYVADPPVAYKNRVTIGTDAVAVEAADAFDGTETSTNLLAITTALELGTTSYWRVDLMSADGLTLLVEGDIWSLLTEAAEPIDSFETYLDTTALRVVWSYHIRSPIGLVVEDTPELAGVLTAVAGSQAAKFVHLAYYSTTGYVQRDISCPTQDERNAISFFWSGLATNTSPSLMEVELLDGAVVSLGTVAINALDTDVQDPLSDATSGLNYHKFTGTLADFGLATFADVATIRINIETTLPPPITNERCTIYIDHIAYEPAAAVYVAGDINRDGYVTNADVKYIAEDWLEVGTMIDDFEAYADTAALQAVWTLMGGYTSGNALTLEAGQSMKMAWTDVTSVGDGGTAGLSTEINNPDIIGSHGVKFDIKGDAGNDPNGFVQLAFMGHANQYYGIFDWATFDPGDPEASHITIDDPSWQEVYLDLRTIDAITGGNYVDEAAGEDTIANCTEFGISVVGLELAGGPGVVQIDNLRVVSGADIDGSNDQNVNLADVAALAADWMDCSWIPTTVCVP